MHTYLTATNPQPLLSPTPATSERFKHLDQEDLDFAAELVADSEGPFLHFIARRGRYVPVVSVLDRGHCCTGDGYQFPWGSLTKEVTQTELAELLDDLVARINGADGYERHRLSFCVLSQAMNVVGLQAPAFRPRPTIPGKASALTGVHMLIQRDRVVIDCHWLYTTKSKVYATEGEWRGIVNPKLTLQTERIEQFAATKLRNDSRADQVLELRHFQQVQMAAMRGERAQAAFKALGDSVVDGSGSRTPAHFRKLTAKLQDWADSQPRFEKLYPKYKAYAMALQLLDSPSVSQVASLAGLILGEAPLSYTAAAQTIQKLKTITAGL
jgi:hypothetical protein